MILLDDFCFCTSTILIFTDVYSIFSCLWHNITFSYSLNICRICCDVSSFLLDSSNLHLFSFVLISPVKGLQISSCLPRPSLWFILFSLLFVYFLISLISISVLLFSSFYLTLFCYLSSFLRWKIRSLILDCSIISDVSTTDFQFNSSVVKKHISYNLCHFNFKKLTLWPSIGLSW